MFVRFDDRPITVSAKQAAWDGTYATYDPLPHAAAFHYACSRYRMVLMWGGFGSAKTIPMCVQMIHNALCYPGFTGLIAREEREAIRGSTMIEFFKLLGGTMEDGGVQSFRDDRGRALLKSWNKSEFKLTFQNGSVIYFGNLQRLRSRPLSCIAVDEANEISPIELQEAIARVGRETTFPHPCLMLCSNIDGLDWMWERFHPDSEDSYTHESQRQRTQALGGVAVFVVPTTRNITLRQDYIDALGALDTVTHQQKVGALFVDNRGGATYYAFNRDAHVRKTRYHPDLPLVLSLDFNKDPLCSVVRQENPPGFVQWIQEYVFSPGTSDMTAQAFLADFDRHRGPVYIRGDATQPGKTATVGTSDYHVIHQLLGRQFGMDKVEVHVRRSNPSIVKRIADMNSMFCNARGETRMAVHPRCRRFIRDLIQTRNAEGTRVPDKAMQKMLTHLSDAAGYDIELEFPSARQIDLPPVQLPEYLRVAA